MKAYKYLLFDLDGTLTNPYEGITRSFQYALNAYGIEEEQSNLTFVIGPPLTDVFRDVYGFSEEKALEALAKYRERFNEVGWRENEILPGIPELLSKLKASGKILCLATSKPEVYALKIIELFDIAKYFDIAVGAELDGSVCEKHQVINKVLFKLGNPPLEEVLMIGDRKHDIIGAKQCSIASLGVKTGFAKENELENAGADYIADTVEDLEKLLLGR
ncbi:MAG: HAD hydrolase-like protein [Clostridia bacterium]|nr:HAD hydrolase-like protein [Clostridia bacterium]